jgi:hypothetical protein
MKRILFGAAALIAVGVLLVPTTGSFVDEPAEADAIHLSPSDGPNSVYVVETDDGTIALDLTAENQRIAADGVNVNSRIEIQDIFTIRSAGGESVTVYIETTVDPAAVTFFRGDGDSRSLHGERNSLTLTGTETAHVGLRVDTRGDAHAISNMSRFTIHVETAADEDPGDGGDDGSGGDGGDSPVDGGGDGSADDGGDSPADGPADGGASDGGTGTDGTQADQDQPAIDPQPDLSSDGEDAEPGDGSTPDPGSVPELTGDDPPELPADTDAPSMLSEETLGSFLNRTLLQLILFVMGGAGLFAGAGYVLRQSS